MIIFLFVQNPLTCFEMEPPLRREKGVGLSEQTPQLLHRHSTRVYSHSRNVQVRALILLPCDLKASCVSRREKKISVIEGRERKGEEGRVRDGAKSEPMGAVKT
jgi:hypothetical protein